ncbi:MAG: sporulation transcriptional regulator SpoIIID [Bacilli bacterium]|nr:sporulation transcriptional regulator SpoIIID [Bacilli bacterium]
MQIEIEERVLETGRRFVLQSRENPFNRPTIRSLAPEMCVSKSTIYKDLTEKLKEYNYALYEEAVQYLQLNKQERASRGGEATKEKYLALHSNPPQN